MYGVWKSVPALRPEEGGREGRALYACVCLLFDVCVCGGLLPINDLGLKTLVQGISSPVPEGHSCSWCGLITTSCVDEVSFLLFFLPWVRKWNEGGEEGRKGYFEMLE